MRYKICSRCGGYRYNPDNGLVDVTRPGIHYLEDQTMWWAAKGPAIVEYVPKFKGLGSGEYTDEWLLEHGYTEKEFELFYKSLEVMRWFEQVFEEFRLVYNPEAPSRLNNLMLCPKLGSGFCHEPRKWTERNHVYEVSVTGKAFTTDSECITEARERAGSALSYGYGFAVKYEHWGKPEYMQKARDEIKYWAKRYWDGSESYGMEETIVDGTAKIIRQITEWDDDD